MNSDFEEDLARQSVKVIPAHWKTEILRAARGAAAPQAQPALDAVARLRAGARELFWPSPLAWGALGAIWVLLLVVSNVSPAENPAESLAPPVSPRELRMARQQHEWLRRELDSEYVVIAPRVPRPDTGSGPRSHAPDYRGRERSSSNYTQNQSALV